MEARPGGLFEDVAVDRRWWERCRRRWEMGGDEIERGRGGETMVMRDDGEERRW
jgi:hypothetical protein